MNCFVFFSYIFSFFFTVLVVARYSLFVLKVPLNTNQPSSSVDDIGERTSIARTTPWL